MEEQLIQTSESDSKSNGPVHRGYQSISRKIWVAPMMDWTDESYFTSMPMYQDSRRRHFLPTRD
jgi:hypothetical protein